MAQVASCPQCQHDLLVPDEASNESWAKCPSCRSFFQIQDAMTRELPAVVLVEADAMEDEAPATPTAEFSSSPTWNEMVDDAPATLDASEIETQLADQETQSAQPAKSK